MKNEGALMGKLMQSTETNDIIRDENDELELVIYSVSGDRPDQQDCFGYKLDKGKCLCIVSDGMGGLNNGRDASDLCVAEFLRAFRPAEGFSVEEELLEPIRSADEKIAALVDEKGKPLNAGCTAVSAMICKRQLNWASVGDSRAYLFRDRQYVRLTKDQNYGTYLDESLRAGMISKTVYADQSRFSEALINYVGMGMVRKSGFIDFNLESLPLCSGDVLMIMSDGVYRLLDDDEINQYVINVPDIVNMAETLEMKMVSVSRDRNIRRDNTSLAVIRIK